MNALGFRAAYPPMLLLQDLVQNLQCLRLAKRRGSVEGAPVGHRGGVDVALRRQAMRPVLHGVDPKVLPDVASTQARGAHAMTEGAHPSIGWRRGRRRSDSRGSDGRGGPRRWKSERERRGRRGRRRRGRRERRRGGRRSDTRGSVGRDGRVDAWSSCLSLC